MLAQKPPTYEKGKDIDWVNNEEKVQRGEKGTGGNCLEGQDEGQGMAGSCLPVVLGIAVLIQTGNRVRGRPLGKSFRKKSTYEDKHENPRRQVGGKKMNAGRGDLVKAD